jgi:hypothetical protein
MLALLPYLRFLSLSEHGLVSEWKEFGIMKQLIVQLLIYGFLQSGQTFALIVRVVALSFIV